MKKELLAKTTPAKIETEAEYIERSDELAELLARGSRRTASQTRLMRLLAVLVEDYDRARAMPPDGGTPAERLQFLMEHSGKNPLELRPVFGQRSHINEALNGKRPISAEQARKLGEIFNVKPGLFV
jgi:HTH-type transcriptional regulator/antitoxin HigA